MKTVYFDIDTQMDFVMPAGSLYAPGAERIIDTIGALNRHAAQTGALLISTMDAHSEDDPEFKTWPHHCVKGTLGQRKPEVTLLSNRLIVPSHGPAGELKGIDQILLEKQHVDCFSNENLPRLIEDFAAERYVVYGVVTEVCVKFAAFGLLKTGRRVEILTDAVCSLKDADAQATLDDFQKSGGFINTSKAILQST
jgi:nicotinamidase/pyrazinamidase